MPLKLKNKITLGSIFLFGLLLLVAVVRIYYFNKQISTSKKVLKNNYESIDYGKNMLLALNDWLANPKANSELFDQNLRMQEKNITEPGEKEMTAALRTAYETFKAHPESLMAVYAIRDNINNVIGLNLNAINRKNAAYQQSAENGKTI